jgi:hypothetical protein
MWGRIEYPILIEFSNEYFESIFVEVVFAETNTNEIKVPIIAPKPNATALVVGEFK